MSTVLDEIDKTVADSDNYEKNEAAPSVKVIDEVKALIASVSLPPVSFHIAPYWGELSVTWRNSGKMLRIEAYPCQKPCVYFCDGQGILPPVHRVEATTQSLNERLAWLMSTE